MLARGLAPGVVAAQDKPAAERSAQKIEAKRSQIDATAGALVALDPRNGEVPALVSRPTYDPNDFAGGIDAATWQLAASAHGPWGL